jgi:hypothetical protein
LAEGGDWTCFANLNVADRQPPTQNLHLCFFTREREHVVDGNNVEALYRDVGNITVRAPCCVERRLTQAEGLTAMRSA